MRSLLVSILSVALLAGFASAALYTDNFDSYADGTELGDSAKWDALDEASLDRDLLIVNPTGSAGEVKWNDWGLPASHSQGGAYYVAVAHAGEPYARAQIDVMMTRYASPGLAWMVIGLNGDPATAGSYGQDNSYQLMMSECGEGFYMMSGDGERVIGTRRSTDPISPVPGQWYTLILEADYSVGGQVTLTSTIKLQGGAVIGTHTAVDTTQLLSGGYAHIQLNDYDWGGGPQDLFMDNFEVEYTPEPATLGLMILGGLALLRRRRLA